MISINIFRHIAWLLVITNTSIVLAHSEKQQQNRPTFCESSKSSSPHCGKTPTSVLDEHGKLWTVYVDGKHIKLVWSQDLGQTFSKPVTINTKPEAISADGENRPKLAIANNGFIYVSWSKKNQSRNSGEIRFSRSIDGGVSFSKPITVNDDGLLISHRYDDLSVMDNGDVYLVWLDKRDLVAAKKAKHSYNGSAIYYAVSKDNGVHFNQNTKIADHTCECCRITTEQDSHGDPIVLWRHIFDDNIRDHSIVNLSEPSILQRVTFDQWQIDACPHHGPDMALDADDNVHIVWFTGKEGRGGLHYGKFNRTENTLQHELHFDDSPLASRPQITLFDQQLYILWKRVEGNKIVLNLKTSNLSNSQWSETIIVAEGRDSTDHPQLIQNTEKLLVTWWTQDKGMQVLELSSKLKNEPLQAFKESSFVDIKKKYQGKDFLMVLWSLDCPPCFKEMVLLEENLQRDDFPKLVLISTNTKDELSQIIHTLEKFSLSDVDNWYFSGVTEQLRYTIDPTWYGELPRSYFFKQDGSKDVHRGLLTQEALDNWLAEN